jgi:hypothetical protein
MSTFEHVLVPNKGLRYLVVSGMLRENSCLAMTQTAPGVASALSTEAEALRADVQY